MTFLRFVVGAALAFSLTACEELPKPDHAKLGPFYTPANVKGVAQLPAEVRRVIMLPIAGGAALTEESVDKLDAIFLTELNRTSRFEVVTISRDALSQLTGGARTVASVDAIPAGLLAKLIRDFGADAVLFTDITSYSPYPPLALGVRAKLARLTDGSLLWSADNVFSADDPGVANAARRHAISLGSDRGPGDLSHTILQNPSRFAGYVADATFQTLPPR